MFTDSINIDGTIRAKLVLGWAKVFSACHALGLGALLECHAECMINGRLVSFKLKSQSGILKDHAGVVTSFL